MKGSALPLLDTFLVEQLMGSEASNAYGAGAIPHQTLYPYAQAIQAHAENYLEGNASKALSDRDAKAYALYYGQLTSAKLFSIIPHLRLPSKKEIKVLDFGAGPGPGLWVMDHVAEGGSYTAIETLPAMKRIIHRLTPFFKKWEISLLESLPHDEFDIIFALNVFSEIAEKEKLFHELYQRLSRKGVIVILEPGSKESTTNLMALREQVLKTYPELYVQYPCSTRRSCPMLQTPDDWCHGTIDWDAPPIIQQLDSLTGFNKHRIKFSALVLQAGQQKIKGLRLLDDPEKFRGGIKVPVCGNEIYGETFFKGSNAKHLRRMRRYDLFIEEDFSFAHTDPE